MAGLDSQRSESGYVDDWQSGKSLADCNLHMLTSEDSCDVSFLVGKDAVLVRAHRYVLISRSCVFHSMLCGPLAETGDIEIQDIEFDIFKDLLRYLYSNNVTLCHFNVTGLLYAAKKYAVGGLEQQCLSYLESSLSAKNACVIMEQAHTFDEKDLFTRALNIVLANGEKCLFSEGFADLCHTCMDAVISSEGLAAKPEEVFKGALSWAEMECRRHEREATPSNMREMLGSTVFEIPFPNMDQTIYVKEVLPIKILTSDENVAIMASLLCPGSDPKPFKRKSFSPVTFDVIFYERCSKTISIASRLKSRGRIDFTCSENIWIVGVYLLGSSSYEKCLTNHIRIARPGDTKYIEDNVYTKAIVTEFQDGQVVAVKLNRPVHIEKDVRHMVYVEIDGTGSFCFGEDVIRNVAVGKYQFTKLQVEHTYSNCKNIVYGLMVHGQEQGENP